MRRVCLLVGAANTAGKVAHAAKRRSTSPFAILLAIMARNATGIRNVEQQAVQATQANDSVRA